MVNDLTSATFPEKVSTSKYLLMQNLPFIGAVAYQIPVMEMSNEGMEGEIAYTDGTRIYMNGEYFEKRPVPEVVSILAHEVGHIVLKSLTRRGMRIPILWNVATDFVINGMLAESTKGAKYFAFPTTSMEGKPISLCLDSKFNGMTAEAVYEQLHKKIQQQLQKMRGNGGNGGGGQSNQGSGASLDLGDGIQIPFDSFDPKTGKIRSRDKEGQEMTDAEIEDYINEILSKAVVTAQEYMRKNNCGKGAGCMLEMVDVMLSHKVDWRKLLHRQLRTFGFEKPDYSRPSRRTMVNVYTGASKFYYPRMRGSKPGNIFMCIDSSGSVSSESLRTFLGEVNNCLRGMPGCKVYLYTCDTEMTRVGIFTGSLPTNVGITGRGGTEFDPAFRTALDLYKSDRDLATFVYFTDGYCSFPNYRNGELPFKVLWCMDNNSADEAPFGKTLRITD